MQSIRATHFTSAFYGRHSRHRKPSPMICLPLLFILLSAVIVALAYSRPNIFALNSSGDGGSDSDNGGSPNSPGLTTNDTGGSGQGGGFDVEGFDGFGFMGVSEQTLIVWASDGLGNAKQLFEPSDSMFASVQAGGQTVAFYVTVHHASWADGDVLSDVSGGAEALTLNPSGVQTVEVWGPLLVSGSYDVVLDKNNNGVFDLGVDSIDVAQVRLVNVIPEVPLGPVVASFGMIAGFAGFAGLRRFVRKRQP